MAKHHQISSCYALMNSIGERSENYLYTFDSIKEGIHVNILDRYPQLHPDLLNMFPNINNVCL